MSKRPGTKSRASGCFLCIFFGFFLAFPLFFLWLITFKGSKVEGNSTVMYLVLLIFLLVGLIGTISGLRILFGSSNKNTNPRDFSPTLPTEIKARLLPNGYYEINPETSHRANFWLMLFVTLFWNGITWAFVIASMSGNKKDGAPLWFMLIFIAAGLLLAGLAVRSFLTIIMVGETSVAVTTPDVVPGQKIEVIISQPGNYTISKFNVDLICREKATYKQGTDTKTKTEIVHVTSICSLNNLTSRNGQTLAHQVCQIPADAVPSFSAPNNKIDWLVRIKLDLPGRPDVEQLFPIRVVPPETIRTISMERQIGRS